MNRRLVLALGCFALIAGLLVFWLNSRIGHTHHFGGKPDPSDPSILTYGPPSTGIVVTNGTAFDQATVDIGTAKKIVLPADAVIRRTGETGKLQLFMAKTLSFGGWPPQPMSPKGARAFMGCAQRIDNGTLTIATYGEWNSHIEGSGFLNLVAIVPNNIALEQILGYSGPDSAANAANGVEVPTTTTSAPAEYWYTPGIPAPGWTAIPTIPDPQRTADQ